jgi:amino acid adenylation domain-containing protein
MLADTDAVYLLIHARYRSLLSTVTGVEIICIDELPDQIRSYSTHRPDGGPVPGDVAYMIYTSGSTGKPKGVLIEHGGMLNHLYAKINDLQITASSVIAQTASYTFDISVWQMLCALPVGGKIIIYKDALILSPVELLRSLDKDKVTIWECVPSYLSSVLSLNVVLPELKSLDYVLTTGEAVSKSLVDKWFRSYSDKRLVNAYGPTEASDDICHYVMDSVPEYNTIPIGKPVQNTKIYIVDRTGNLCPLGVKGELCISGIGVGRGYWRDTEKTDRSFVKNPFEEVGFRMYRTGDLARWLPDGNIDYIGRIDEQVKIRGYRIELQEIESMLLQQPGVEQGVVVAKEDGKGLKRLLGYVVLKDGADKGLIEEGLSAVLPEYMIPRQWIELKALPLTSNGKIDKKALPDVEIVVGEDYIAPSSELEEQLVEIWAGILKLDKTVISINKNFFELGGNSLKILELASVMNQSFTSQVTVANLFSYPTISLLVDFLKNNNDKAAQQQEEIKEELSGMDSLFNLIEKE